MGRAAETRDAVAGVGGAYRGQVDPFSSQMICGRALAYVGSGGLSSDGGTGRVDSRGIIPRQRRVSAQTIEGEHGVRRKFLSTLMDNDWKDGRGSLWNPVFDMIPLVVTKIEVEGGRGVMLVPNWPAKPSFARFCTQLTHNQFRRGSQRQKGIIQSTIDGSCSWWRSTTIRLRG